MQRFVTVAEELNFTRAAARLHIAQPSLSVQIRRLETEVGVELLSRKARTIKLSEPGRIFLQQARKTLLEAKRGIMFARGAAQGEIGNLMVGYNTIAEFYVFPTIFPAFRRRWVNVHLEFQHLKAVQQLDALRRDELDLGFVWAPIPPGDFDSHELMRESNVVLVPADHRLAAKSDVSIKDLTNEPLVLPSRTLEAEAHRQLQQLFSNAGAVMNVAYEQNSLLSIINFVGMGAGCSVLPSYVCGIRRPGVVIKPLRGPNPARSLMIVKKKGRGDVADLFYRFSIDHLQAYEASRLAAAGLKSRVRRRARCP